jgi:hypothetical protein
MDNSIEQEFQSSTELRNLDTAHFGAENKNNDNNSSIFKSLGMSSSFLSNGMKKASSPKMKEHEVDESKEDSRLLESLEKRIRDMDDQETERKP